MTNCRISSRKSRDISLGAGGGGGSGTEGFPCILDIPCLSSPVPKGLSCWAWVCEMHTKPITTPTIKIYLHRYLLGDRCNFVRMMPRVSIYKARIHINSYTTIISDAVADGNRLSANLSVLKLNVRLLYL